MDEKNHHSSGASQGHPKHHHNHNVTHSPHHIASHRKSSNFLTSITSNPWAIATVILAIVLIVVIVVNYTGGSNSTEVPTITAEEAGQIVVDFAEAQGLTATVLSTEMESGLYMVNIEVQGQEVPVYLTPDGKNLVPTVLPLAELMNQASQTPTTQEPAPTNVPKTDRPKVELFVMTHCPYGTQAEKGFVPVMKILEKQDVADVEIRFVHYFLHDPEEDETPIQVCIREEQSEKFIPYLEAFLADGDSKAAMKTAGVDADAVQDCIDNGNAEKYYAEDSALSEGYGVRGSPSLVINGAQSSAGRSESAYLSGICAAFTDAPSALCDLELDSTNPAPGFGYGGSSAAATAACG